MSPGRGGGLATPQRLAPPGDSARDSASQPWAPWASVVIGLLFAGGVTAVVVNRRQRRKEQGEADGPSSRA
ncbi:MAG: hypothetical protein ACK6BG_06850 [Cyanobacteriota bacterium]